MIKFIAFGFVLILASCSSSPDVRPGLDGIHSISIRGEDAADTESNAHKQAKSFCHGKGLNIEFLSDETFKATSTEASVPASVFKKGEAVATDLKFKCVE